MDSVYVPFQSQTSRTSGPQLAFAVIHLVVGCYLLLLGRRTWRITCAVSLGLAFELVAFAVAVNTIGVNGINSSFSDSNNDLVLFGIIVSLGLFGFLFSLLIPKRFYAGWWPGYVFLGGLAGLSVGFGIIILGSGEGMLIGSIAGRWALSGVLAVVGIAGVMATRWRGAMAASCLIGAFLLAVGIDLIVNGNKGSSLGLRKLLDSNSSHAAALRPYNPPLSMSLLIGLSWALAGLFMAFQEFAYKDRPFLQLHRDQSLIGWRSYIPFTSRSSSIRHETDLEKGGITSPGGNMREVSDNGEEVLAASHSAHDSSPHSEWTLPSEYADDSEIRRLTANYERALAALEDENIGYASTTTGTDPRSPATADIPIQYRPSPSSPNPNNEQERQLPIPLADPTLQPELADLQRRTAAPQGPRAQQLRPNAEEMRAGKDWDRGTTYSVPMTNFTASEYGDRDMRRPPTWVGDLPWHPDMLKGELDPNTLPRHPPTTDPSEELAQPHARPVANTTVAVPPAQAGQPASNANAEEQEEGFEVVQMYEVPPQQAQRQGPVISQPLAMQSYASRPLNRTTHGSPTFLGKLSPHNSYISTSQGGGGIPKTVRRGSRDQSMFPAEDDLPEQSHTLNTGHSRLNTSETAVEGPGAFQDKSDDEGDFDVASSHASYSLSNFRQAKKPKRRLPEEAAMSEEDRPVTQSDLTPMLQSMPSPTRPVLVHKDSPGIQSNMASLTTASIAQGSEGTVRPGEEQRRSMELDSMLHGTPRSSNGGEEGDRRVRFNATPPGTGIIGRRTLRDRLLGRRSS